MLNQIPKVDPDPFFRKNATGTPFPSFPLPIQFHPRTPSLDLFTPYLFQYLIFICIYLGDDSYATLGETFPRFQWRPNVRWFSRLVDHTLTIFCDNASRYSFGTSYLLICLIIILLYHITLFWVWLSVLGS